MRGGREGVLSRRPPLPVASSPAGNQVPQQVHTELLCEQTTEPLCPGERGLCALPPLSSQHRDGHPNGLFTGHPSLKLAAASTSTGPRHPRQHNPKPSSQPGHSVSPLLPPPLPSTWLETSYHIITGAGVPSFPLEKRMKGVTDPVLSEIMTF